MAAPLPSCGWWVEDSQPKIAPSGVYHGTQNATLPLGEALRRMVAGTLGAPLVAGSEWERLELHLEAVANHRQASFRPPPDVKATASGTLLPHMAAASLFMVDAPKFFDSKARSGYGPRYAGLNDHPQPPDGEQPHLVLDEQSPGFGVIYLRLVFPQWRDGERTRSQD